ncbi:EAL domain-containing protein [Defluviitalea raffinosedens]|uniref:EAL domain-containing protein n=1 Tax=Defluviitalea raffinosedens TaxID=1450156 RepID=A0A7C8HF06_9FIRM|nr:bifunctional diguanylate cyclase/phosphodiesterase [Defluviitalea raffinosedens]KAE9634943.1 EAL domain-containing protein [Defluviitalea raffinosedens]HHW66575.1 bifunctional diguanylate cyclase/phosphodiesterase [Candidatus Epulonipiscium sp.]
MKAEHKFKRLDTKVFIISFLVITMIFFGISKIIIYSIREYYFSRMQEDSINFAKSYSYSLSKAAEAKDVVNELLEEKLLVASRAIALYDGQYSNQLLKELADILKVDEIAYYNAQGEIIYSNVDAMVGWKAYEGHLFYDFMMSEQASYIAPIKQDSKTGKYFKYAYFKISDDRFLEIGVKSEKIYNFLGSFEIRKLLDEIQEVEGVAKVFFIDNQFNITRSSKTHFDENKIITPEIRNAIYGNREYSYISTYDEEKEYQAFVPVYLENIKNLENIKIGTLAIGQSLREAEEIIKNLTGVILVALLIIYALLIYIMISTYQKNEKLIHLAYYDGLTGLPNEHYLKEILTKELEKNEKARRALLLINCKNFRMINMTYGYDYGDEILKELTKRIQNLEDGSKILFRFSADRFALFMKHYSDQQELVSVVNKIIKAFKDPFKVKNVEQNINVEIGIVEIHNKYDHSDRILKDVSIALSGVKENDAGYAFFNKVMENKLQREDLIEKEIRAAITENDTSKIYLEYQPQVDLKSNKITGFEALARMRTKKLGFVSPMEFIDVAEKKQLIVPLGNFILTQASEFIRDLTDKGFKDIKVAVNVSGIQLLRYDFTDTIMKIISDTGIEPSSLELEITESVLLGNYNMINEKLKNLRNHQIEIALDDFGTGYSSFARLIELNIDTLKIDRYFINNISIKDSGDIITGDIISMAHKLGLKVVAEGVEVPEQKNYLMGHHCDRMQGYLFSKPLSKEKALKMLFNQNK